MDRQLIIDEIVNSVKSAMFNIFEKVKSITFMDIKIELFVILLVLTI